MDNISGIYQQIGEFMVSFQWIENKLREIGWFIIDPEYNEYPPKGLRNLTNEKLIDAVHALFIEALPKCMLPNTLESEFRMSFDSCVSTLHQLRQDRNKILHSTFIELKSSCKVQALIRSNPKLATDKETGKVFFDQECLKSDSFDKEMEKMAEVAFFLNKVHIQFIHRYPNGGLHC